MARMTGFVFQDKYLDRLAKLSDQEVGRLVRALATYHATGEEQELKGRECGYYDFIKGDIDEIEQAYQKKCKNMKREQLPAIDRNCPQLPATADNINININKKSCNSGNSDNARADEDILAVDVDPLIVKVQRELNGLTDTHYQALNDYREELTDEVVSHAIDNAVANGSRNWAYVESILRAYTQEHITTIGAAKAADEKHRANKTVKFTPRNNGPKPYVNPYMDMLKEGVFDDIG
jgi:DnaD/phage-associated family protein